MRRTEPPFEPFSGSFVMYVGTMVRQPTWNGKSGACEVITERKLRELGFVKDGKDWVLDVLPNDGWPTRMIVLDCKNPQQVFIEQAEYVGEPDDGWDWESGNCISVQCDDRQLAALVRVLTVEYNCTTRKSWMRLLGRR